MRTDLLLEQFDTLVRTAEDVAGLELGILNLAVRGQLLPQDPNDETAADLLNRIWEKTAETTKQGRSHKTRRPLPVRSSETPFSVPPGWEWRRLEHTVDILDSQRIPVNAKERDARITGKREDELVPYYGATRQVGWIDDFLFDEELVLLGEDGVRFYEPLKPKAYVISGKSWVNNHAHVLRGRAVLNKFLCHYLNTFDYIGYVSGTTRLKLNQSKMKRIPVPIPPLAEQRRIVTWVDELLAQTRALAAQLQAADEALVPAAQASFQALTDEPDEASQGEAWHQPAWRRVNAAFDALTADPRTLDALKQTVLQLAVQGKLVPQDPDDEPASVLLKRIKAERRQSAQDNKKKSRRSPRRGSSETPYALPNQWEWVKVDDIAEHRLGKMLDKHKNKGTFYPYLRNLNVQWLRIDLDDILEMRFESHEVEEYELKPEDLLVCEGGEPGRCAIWEYPDTQMMFQKALHRIRPLGGILPKYVLYHLWADASSGALSKYFTGATIKHFTGKSLSSYLVALPPLAEQKRIVAKVESLLALCDKLAAEVVAAEEVRRRLLAAVLNGE